MARRMISIRLAWKVWANRDHLCYKGSLLQASTNRLALTMTRTRKYQCSPERALHWDSATGYANDDIVKLRAAVVYLSCYQPVVRRRIQGGL